MIGNDIVDLKQAAKDSNWKRPRFLDKIFTPKEQLFISASESKAQMVWLLWSMKEAAYKAYVRETECRFFNPKRIQCQLMLHNQGIACIDKKSYYLKSVITSEYVHSIAVKAETLSLEVHHFKLFEANQGEIVRVQLLKYISLKKGKDLRSFEIKKTASGVPNVFSNQEQVCDALSMSHHGKYGAFAIC
ncbi:4'-phosphopantetheinyl transferase family protein [Psychroserpens mesophilus]|uniref:4'-phosphopantetheinyl transferase family protein n=1 Tax=Psychroserpens mesophilus TaxID=325473 RepID=UPI003D657067